MAHRVLATAATVGGWSGLLFVLYLVLITDVTPLEAVVGGSLAVLGGVAAEAVRRAEHPRVHGRRRLAAAFAALPWTLFAETAQLAVAVARAAGRGDPSAVGPAATPARPGGHDGDRPVAVRVPADTDPALAAALLTATPGACVLDIAGRELTVHLLGDKAAPSAVERALGGRRPA
ncbi:Na+/H+ antiporter subunit E [Actinacidiphila paucisporea]|uniref:Multisubunit Na+/H+ antiporter, MnhE subunit n=1 Tax=Actinacidiphila paucisporea TaxID=310782 RepID=A0A1M7FZT1_9ACTN|nr:Na+/H+ antiporter subunit E [Actinacidiphila paucisporea]SHM09500.1 Multisubunit Na+/H+ antiporter, MnhE subunit [Actinacidiphila paucisporea]